MKQNEAALLRQKLDGLDARQVDKDFDPDILWGAIEQQLQAPKLRRTVSLPIYVWSAAACLLVGAFLSFWVLRSGISTPQPVAKQTAPAEIFTPKPAPETAVVPLPNPAPVVAPVSVFNKEVARVLPVRKEVIIPEKPDSNLPAVIVETPVLVKEVPVAVLPSPTQKQPLPRAPHLLDAALDAHDIVVEKDAENASMRRLPFLLSPSRFPTETAFQTPSSILRGLRR